MITIDDPATGRLVAPADPEWDDARRAFNTTLDLRPAAVARPADEREVAAVIAYARRHGLRVAPQATGHGAGAHGDLTDTIIVSTSRLTSVTIDGPARRVRVGAGVKWERVTPQLSELGLAALPGRLTAGPLAAESDGRELPDRDGCRHPMIEGGPARRHSPSTSCGRGTPYIRPSS